MILALVKLSAVAFAGMLIFIIGYVLGELEGQNNERKRFLGVKDL